MAHQVESMFSVKQTPWHGLGVILPTAPSIDEAIVAAGLDWQVKLYRLQTQNMALPVVSNKAVVRESDKKVLGVVGRFYKPLQNTEAFNWFQPFIDAKEAHITTAGSLDEGRKVWVLAELNKTPAKIAKGDEIKKYLLLSNSHDGSTSIRVGFTPIRVVCNNTLSLSHRDRSSQLIRIKHSKNAAQNLGLLRDAINTTDQKFQATADLYKHLCSRQIHKGDLEKYVRMVFFPKIVNIQKESIRTQNNFSELKSNIERLFSEGRGNDLPGVRGTYWAMYNAANEYLNYYSGNNQNDRIDSLWFGKNAKLNDAAFESALMLASA